MNRSLRVTVFTISIAFLVFASGCKTTWSDADRASLSQVGVAPLGSKPNAYHKPDPTLSPGMATAIPVATGGGLIPALVGSAIDAKVKSNQRKAFEVTAAQHFGAIESMASSDPAELLRVQVERMLVLDEFFGSRFKKDAPTRFTINIERHGFVRSLYATKEAMTLVYEIVAHVELSGAKNKKLIKQLFDGQSEQAFMIDELVEQPDLVAEARLEAAESFARNLQRLLDAKLGRAM